MNEELLKVQLPTSSRVLKLVLHALIDYLLLQLPTGSCVLKHQQNKIANLWQKQLPTGSCVLKLKNLNNQKPYQKIGFFTGDR